MSYNTFIIDESHLILTNDSVVIIPIRMKVIVGIICVGKNRNETIFFKLLVKGSFISNINV